MLSFSLTIYFGNSYADFTIECEGEYEEADRSVGFEGGYAVEDCKIICKNGSEYRGPVSRMNHDLIVEAASDAERERTNSSMAEEWGFARGKA